MFNTFDLSVAATSFMTKSSHWAVGNPLSWMTRSIFRCGSLCAFSFDARSALWLEWCVTHSAFLFLHLGRLTRCIKIIWVLNHWLYNRISVCLHLDNLCPHAADTVPLDKRFTASFTVQARLLVGVNLRSTLAQAADTQVLFRHMAHMRFVLFCLCSDLPLQPSFSIHLELLAISSSKSASISDWSEFAAHKQSETNINRSSTVHHHSSRIACVTTLAQSNIVDGALDREHESATLSRALSPHLVHCSLLECVSSKRVAWNVEMTATALFGDARKHDATDPPW